MITALSVGQPFPFPLPPGEGMQAQLTPGADSLGIILVCAMARPSASEITAIRKKPLRLALLPSPPLVWFVLATDGLSLDAPYAVERHESIPGVLTSAQLARAWPETMRNLATVVLVDASDGMIRALRAVSLSRAWWLVLADALASEPRPIDAKAHDAAIARDLRRWPQTEDMLAAATISEIGGTL